MQIETITSKDVDMVRQRLSAAVKAEADKLGITVTFGNARYSPSTIEFKAKCAVGNKETAERNEFERLAPSVGVDPSAYGETVIVQGEIYKLVGVNPRAPKYPLIGERSDGKRYRFTTRVLQGI